MFFVFKDKITHYYANIKIFIAVIMQKSSEIAFLPTVY